jgi:6-pyruvoyl-tetrahydropterin synthase
MMNGDFGLDTMEDSILSLSDPTYRHILEGFFIRLGPKMKGKKTKVNESELTEAEAAEEVFNIFKNKGGRLLKRQKDWREKNASGVVAVDDEEARKSKYHTMTGDCLTNLFC